MRSSLSGPELAAPEPLTVPAAGFAHRGLHGPGAPENSMAAFRAGIAAGAGIECDVRLSADDMPMPIWMPGWPAIGLPRDLRVAVWLT